MRSRYTGFATRRRALPAGQLAPEHPARRARAGRRRWSGTGWTCSATDAGGPWDDAGTVEFVAHYRLDDGTAIGQRGRLHETSRFVREDGRWLYVDGGIDAIVP